jgi:hypothetical protein
VIGNAALPEIGSDRHFLSLGPHSFHRLRVDRG